MKRTVFFYLCLLAPFFLVHASTGPTTAPSPRVSEAVQPKFATPYLPSNALEEASTPEDRTAQSPIEHIAPKTAKRLKNKTPKQNAYRPLETLSFASLLLSIIGLIVTLASLPVAGLFAAVAALLGFGGLSKFAKRHNEFKGEGLAIAGICIATLTFAIILVDLLL